MSITYYRGDILSSQAEAITIPVNCVGVMGKGLAKQAAETYPHMFKTYKDLCKQHVIKPGHIHIVNCERKIILFATKDHWRHPSQLCWIKSGLKYMQQIDGTFTSIAIPAVGCGLGGLDWKTVETYITDMFTNSITELHIYPPI